MTLKEELEVLRGEPIAVYCGDPIDIPCIETSDSEKLCKHPVVSVNMITYNHEPYIRQAIEGVMMQKTDFEFELIIGEDCSQDKTREICFEYQKRYPDKIRVLWWHENVSKLGGNSRRVRARCRGEFIALCEGDDYWIDPLKLQKQVDIMRKHPNVGLCFCNAKIQRVGHEAITWGQAGCWRPGMISGREFLLKHIFGVWHQEVAWSTATFLMTASVMMRQSVIDQALSKYDVFSWRLWLGDTTLWLGLSSLSDVYYLNDCVSVYNQVPSGALGQHRGKVEVDALTVRLYYADKLFFREFKQMPMFMRKRIFSRLMELAMTAKGDGMSLNAFRHFLQTERLRRVMLQRDFILMTCMFYCFGINNYTRKVCGRFFTYFLGTFKIPQWIRNEYDILGLSIDCHEKCFWQRCMAGFKKRFLHA